MTRIRTGMAIVCLACATWAGEAGAKGMAGDYGDGFVTEPEVCSGAPDLFQQDDLFRPWGGVLLVAPGLSADKRAAITEAARQRYETSGAVWRVVSHDQFGGTLPVGLDALLVASCSAPTPLTWVQKKPSGGLAVTWGAAPSSSWVPAIKQSLALAEGDGPL